MKKYSILSKDTDIINDDKNVEASDNKLLFSKSEFDDKRIEAPTSVKGKYIEFSVDSSNRETLDKITAFDERIFQDNEKPIEHDLPPENKALKNIFNNDFDMKNVVSAVDLEGGGGGGKCHVNDSASSTCTATSSIKSDKSKTLSPDQVRPRSPFIILKRENLLLFTLVNFIVLFLGILWHYTTTKKLPMKNNLSSELLGGLSEVSTRETEIRKEISKIIGESSNTEEKDGSTVTDAAIDWIINKDPLLLSATSENLIQRYLCVLFYLSTTQLKPWLSCNRPEEGEDSNCTALDLVTIEPEIIYEEKTGRKRWLSSEHECSWNGVYCNSLFQIQALNLWAQEIRGTFPTELTKMSYLQSLSLLWNEFSGTLPSEIADMKYLLNIELHYNHFTGKVPVEWYREIRNLQRINVGGNFLSGTIPTEIGLLKGVKGYFNFENDIFGKIPTEIGLMKELSYMRLGRNFITGSVPSEIGKLRKLQEIWIHRNQLTSTLPTELGMLQLVDDVRLHYNSFSGEIPEDHYKMTTLRRWDLYDNNFTSTISTKIGNLKNLAHYRIRGNQFNGTIPSELAQIRSLNSLWLHLNRLSGEVPSELCAIRGSSTGIQSLQVDCLKDNIFDHPQVECMKECCTLCCDPTTEICFST